MHVAALLTFVALCIPFAYFFKCAARDTKQKA